MRYFPFFFDTQDKSILVVGGGIQASSKVRLLTKTKARITVVSPDINEDLRQFLAVGRIEWHQRLCHNCDFINRDVVYVATQSDALNADLGQKARAVGALVAAVDQADASDIITPAIIDRDPVVVAIGTEGTSPVLARLIKSRLTKQLPAHLGRLAAWAGSQRKRLEHKLGSSRERRLFWSRFFRFSSPFSKALDSDEVMTRRVDMMLSVNTPPSGAVTLIDATEPEADLMPLRAINRLHDADTIIHDADIPSAYLEHARREAKIILLDLGGRLEALIQKEVNNGHHVIRLINGNAQTIVHEFKQIKQLGINVERLPALHNLSVHHEPVCKIHAINQQQQTS